MRSPGRTSTRSPTASSEAATGSIASPRMRRAVRGMRSTSALTPARARLAATPSSSSPTANRNTTTAASGASPIAIAPMAATDISVSMLNGVPLSAPAAARRTTGMRPSNAAAIQGHCDQPGSMKDTAQAAASSAPLANTRRALGEACHGPSEGPWSWSCAAAPCAAGTIALKPRLSTLARIVSRLVRSSSTVIDMDEAATLTSTSATPGRRRIAVSILAAQEPQSMPSIRSFSALAVAIPSPRKS